MTEPRYRLRADAFFVATGDGVSIQNNRGALSLDGRDAYALVKYLFAKLEHGVTMDELCGDAGAARRRVLEAIVRRFEQHGFVKRVGPAEDVPSWARELYGEQLRFIEHHLDEPFARFSQFRARRVACMGAGPLLRATLTALAEYGAGHVTVVTSTDESLEPLLALADAIRQRDPGVVLEVRPEGDAAPPQACDLLLLDDGPPHGATRVARPAADELVAAVMRIDERLVVTPALDATAPICLECIRCSVARAGGEHETTIPPTAASLAANQLVFGLFSRIVGVGVPVRRDIHVVDCRTLSVKAHRVSPHPWCERHGHAARLASAPQAHDSFVRPDLPSGLDEPALIEAQDVIATRMGRWSDPVTGPLIHVGEGDLSQRALAASKCVVQDPTEPYVVALHSVVCRGPSAREARNQAVLLALEWQAAKLLARQRDPLDLPAAGYALGVGWSVGEAMYRALHHLTRASATWPSAFEASDDDVRAMSVGSHLLELVAEYAPAVAFATAVASTGLMLAAARTAGGMKGHGVGVSKRAAQVHALLDLAGALVAPEPPAHTVALTLDVRSWSHALSAAQARQGGTPVSLRTVEGLFPFASDDLHVVLAEG